MRAVIIGGGIIGLFSALYLRRSGWEVTIIDKGDMLNSCSYGNAGMITPSHFVPLASPGVVRQGVKWMFRRGSPFSLSARITPALLRWGVHFLRSASPRHVERSAIPLRDLLVLGRSLYEDLLEEPGFDFSLQTGGIIMYFRTEKAAEEETALALRARQLGLETEVYDTRQLRELEPALDVSALGGVHYKCDAHVYPGELMRQLQQQLRNMQVKWIRNITVRKFDAYRRRVKAALTKGIPVEGDLFILAGGAWSGAVASSLGLSIPLVPGKGYSVTVDKPRTLPRYPAILCEARVAITPMDGKLRFGGTMQIGAVSPAISMSRIKGMVNAMNAYLPGLETELPPKEKVWAGFRPVSADGLPYLGRTAKYDNLIIATGHSMMGLGMGPATGKLVAELAGGGAASLNLEAFRPDRF